MCVSHWALDPQGRHRPPKAGLVPLSVACSAFSQGGSWALWGGCVWPSKLIETVLRVGKVPSQAAGWACPMTKPSTQLSVNKAEGGGCA